MEMRSCLGFVSVCGICQWFYGMYMLLSKRSKTNLMSKGAWMSFIFSFLGKFFQNENVFFFGTGGGGSCCFEVVGGVVHERIA